MQRTILSLAAVSAGAIMMTAAAYATADFSDGDLTGFLYAVAAVAATGAVAIGRWQLRADDEERAGALFGAVCMAAAIAFVNSAAMALSAPGLAWGFWILHAAGLTLAAAWVVGVLRAARGSGAPTEVTTIDRWFELGGSRLWIAPFMALLLISSLLLVGSVVGKAFRGVDGSAPLPPGGFGVFAFSVGLGAFVVGIVTRRASSSRRLRRGRGRAISGFISIVLTLALAAIAGSIARSDQRGEAVVDPVGTRTALPAPLPAGRADARLPLPSLPRPVGAPAPWSAAFWMSVAWMTISAAGSGAVFAPWFGGDLVRGTTGSRRPGAPARSAQT